MAHLIDYFIDVFRQFVVELENEFPKYEISFRNVMDYLDEKDPEELFYKRKSVIEQFKLVSEVHYEALFNKNVNFFDNKESLEFILGLDFTEIFSNEELSDNSKTAIMDYLHLLAVTVHHIDLDSVEYTGDGNDIISSVLNSMSGGMSSESLNIDPSEITSLLGTLNLGDTPAGDVFKDVLMDVTSHVTDMLKDGKNPMELLGGILNNEGGSEIQNIMSSISTTLDAKVKSGEIKQEDLYSVSNNVLNSINSGEMMSTLNTPNKEVDTEIKNIMNSLSPTSNEKKEEPSVSTTDGTRQVKNNVSRRNKKRKKGKK